MDENKPPKDKLDEESSEIIEEEQKSDIVEDDTDSSEIIEKAKDTNQPDGEEKEEETLQNKTELLYACILETASEEEVNGVLQELWKKYGRAEYLRRRQQVGTDVFILEKMNADRNPQSLLNRSAIDKCDINLLQNMYRTKDFVLADSRKAPDYDYGGAVLSGTEAQIAISASNKTNKKVMLYNSGIHLVLRGPKLGEINACYNRIIDRINEYQYEFGAHFYLFNDFIIKEAIFELLYSLIIECNYKGWSQNKAILKAIKLSDWNTIVHAIGSLMYEKYPYYFACTNSETKNGKRCTYTEKFDIDLKTLRRNRYDKIPEEAMALLVKKGKRTDSDLLEYERLLNISEKIHLYDNYYGYTRVPTLEEYFEFGRQFNKQIIESIWLDDDKKIAVHVTYNLYKVYAIWFNRIDLVKEDGEVNASFRDLNSITSILDITQLEDTDFGDRMIEVIEDSTITHISIPFKGCPECGYIPDYCKNGRITFDCQSHFFSMSVMKLMKST